MQLLSKANKLGVPIPKEWWKTDDDLQWAEGKPPLTIERDRKRYLNRDHRRTVHSMIKKALLEMWGKKIVILAGIATILFGLIPLLILILKTIRRITG